MPTYVFDSRHGPHSQSRFQSHSRSTQIQTDRAHPTNYHQADNHRVTSGISHQTLIYMPRPSDAYMDRTQLLSQPPTRPNTSRSQTSRFATGIGQGTGYSITGSASNAPTRPTYRPLSGTNGIGSPIPVSMPGWPQSTDGALDEEDEEDEVVVDGNDGLGRRKRGSIEEEVDYEEAQSSIPVWSQQHLGGMSNNSWIKGTGEAFKIESGFCGEMSLGEDNDNYGTGDDDEDEDEENNDGEIIIRASHSHSRAPASPLRTHAHGRPPSRSGSHRFRNQHHESGKMASSLPQSHKYSQSTTGNSAGVSAARDFVYNATEADMLLQAHEDELASAENASSDDEGRGDERPFSRPQTSDDAGAVDAEVQLRTERSGRVRRSGNRNGGERRSKAGGSGAGAGLKSNARDTASRLVALYRRSEREREMEMQWEMEQLRQVSALGGSGTGHAEMFVMEEVEGDGGGLRGTTVAGLDAEEVKKAILESLRRKVAALDKDGWVYERQGDLEAER